MRVPVHLLVCWVICGLSFVHTTLYYEIALKLSLGPKILTIVEFWPFALILAYVVLVLTTRTPSRRGVFKIGAAAVVALAFLFNYYPDWLVQRNTQKIEIRPYLKVGDRDLSPDVIARFEQKFGTPTIQYYGTGGDPWLVVRRDRYSSSMLDFLAEESPARQTAPGPIR